MFSMVFDLFIIGKRGGCPCSWSLSEVSFIKFYVLLSCTLSVPSRNDTFHYFIHHMLFKKRIIFGRGKEGVQILVDRKYSCAVIEKLKLFLLHICVVDH